MNPGIASKAGSWAGSDSTRFVTWAVPGKVEELRASLQAYLDQIDVRAAFLDSIKQSTGSLTKLPQELVDKIMEETFDALREENLHKWKMAYLFSSKYNDIRAMGTLYGIAMSFLPPTSGKIHQRLREFASHRCTQCRAIRSAKIGDTPDDTAKQPLTTQLDLSCTACQACMQYCHNEYYDDSCSNAREVEEEFEEDICYGDFNHGWTAPYYEDNPLDQHPEAMALWEALTNCNDVQVGYFGHVYARTWFNTVRHNRFFSRAEREILFEHFGVHCYVVRDEESPGVWGPTTALLVAQDPPQIYSSDHFSRVSRVLVVPQLLSSTQEAQVPVLTDAQRSSFRQAIKHFRLSPCSALDRADCEEGDVVTTDAWPSPISLNITSAQIDDEY